MGQAGRLSSVAGKAGAFGARAGRMLDFLLPPLCLACGAHLSGHGFGRSALCAGCWGLLDFIEEPLCTVTGLPFAFDPGPDLVSAVAVAHPPVYAHARAAMRYNAMSGRLIQKLKYGDRLDLAHAFARWMVRAGAALIREADLIAPVPLHASRLRKRRFNQSAELARDIGRATGARVVPDLLVRVRATPPQIGLSASARRRNVAGAFVLPVDKVDLVRDRTVLLVDDVLTTGATVEACATVLLTCGAARVDVLTLARVVPGDEAHI